MARADIIKMEATEIERKEREKKKRETPKSCANTDFTKVDNKVPD